MVLNSIARFLTNRMLVRPLPGPFVRTAGLCWLAKQPRDVAKTAEEKTPSLSTLAVYEDGKPLRPALSSVADICALGGGRNCCSGESVFFSTSDDTDPNTNGRCYAFSLSPWLFKRRLGADGGWNDSLPSNHRRRASGRVQIRADVAYALQVGGNYLKAIRGGRTDLDGLTVLEIGPGINDGAVLFLAALGIRPFVADRFLAPWDAAYHPRFYAALRDAILRQEPLADVRPINALLRAGGYDERIITRFDAPLEKIPVPSASVDVVVSNAVLEHTFDLRKCAEQLARVTRPGGLGWHQVDFRDHRDFRRPLEYLLLGEEEFQRVFLRCHGECGNRHRPDDAADWLRTAGFEIQSFEPNILADADYLESFLPRLAAAGSSYRSRTTESLRAVSGHFTLRKPGADAGVGPAA